MTIFEKNKNFKANLKKTVSPVSVSGDQMNIVGDNNVVIIKQEQKEDFYHSLEDVDEDELLKNGEFEEEFVGVIRKLDLDARQNNYFGFNIDNGPHKVPTAVSGEFNLNLYKELIDEHIKIKARIRYKDDVPIRIEILHYDFLDKQEKIDL